MRFTEKEMSTRPRRFTRPIFLAIVLGAAAVAMIHIAGAAVQPTPGQLW